MSRGAGIGTHVALLGILRRIGIPFDESMGVRVDRVICLDRDGSLVTERPTVRVMSAWGRLYRALLDPLPSGTVRFGMTLE